MNTTVKELTVTVKALAVNGRGMSKAFFRQIPERYDAPYEDGEEYDKHLDDNDSYISPIKEGIELWGIVQDDGEWLVYQQGGVLYRTDLIYDFDTRVRGHLRRTLPQLFIGA